MSSICGTIKVIEKLSLVTCTNEVLRLLEQTIANIDPVLKVDTKNRQPLVWQVELNLSQLREDYPSVKLTRDDLKKNASGFFEDYIAIGSRPGSH